MVTHYFQKYAQQHICIYRCLYVAIFTVQMNSTIVTIYEVGGRELGLTRHRKVLTVKFYSKIP